MSEHSTEVKNSIQSWIVSLGISVFCCALFFALMSNYVNKLDATLNKIDDRLAALEVLASAPKPEPMPMPLTVQPTPGMPSVQIPTVDAPSPAGSTETMPSAVPMPEAIAPVMPSVPPSAVPINIDEPTKQ